ncbi:MAG: hypothetical protein LBL90_10880 [Prevotellaceae bacterium]|jgi:hypothetical protein|nr:hypothetical protein [Prevotellaceae bacterium]
MLSDFKNGDVVCLTFNRGKKLLVESNVIINGKIQLVFSNEDKGIIQQAFIEPKYLAIDVIDGKRLEELIRKFPNGMKSYGESKGDLLFPK